MTFSSVCATLETSLTRSGKGLDHFLRNDETLLQRETRLGWCGWWGMLGPCHTLWNGGIPNLGRTHSVQSTSHPGTRTAKGQTAMAVWGLEQGQVHEEQHVQSCPFCHTQTHMYNAQESTTAMARYVSKNVSKVRQKLPSSITGGIFWLS